MNFCMCSSSDGSEDVLGEEFPHLRAFAKASFDSTSESWSTLYELYKTCMVKR